MSKMSSVVLAAMVIALVITLTVAQSETAWANSTFMFSVNLSYGMKSSDVIVLQELLNKDPRTQIAASGVGSPGQESDYFGTLTRAAVIRFQNIYAAEVLTPAGLSLGTGFVGLYTRNELNALLSASTSSATVASTTSSTTISSNTTSNIQGPVYTTATTTNNAFTPHDLNSFISEQIQLLTGTTSISEFTGSSTSGITYTPSATFGSTSSLPQIISVSPTSTINTSTLITVTGANFTSHNTITSGMGIISNVSSADGKTLSFSLSQFSGANTFTAVPSGVTTTLLFGISNEHGASQSAGVLNVEY